MRIRDNGKDVIKAKRKEDDYEWLFGGFDHYCIVFFLLGWRGFWNSKPHFIHVIYISLTPVRQASSRRP